MTNETSHPHALVRSVIPTVIESDGRVERAFDIFSLLLRERIIFLGTPIDDQVSNLVVAQMLFLQREDPERDISLYIHSPGGVISSGMAIYDTMQLVTPDVSTIAVGQTASMATVLLCGGAKGKRFALPSATVHMHQAISAAQGQARDIEIAAKEVLRNNEIIRNIIVEQTGQPMERVIEDMDRDYYLDAEGAKEYGLIDDIMVGPEDRPAN